MYIKPHYRKMGIGKDLIHAVINYAKKHVMQLHLTCETSNLKALNLYQNMGFVICGTEPRALKIGHEFYDEYLMVLQLDNENKIR